MHPKDLGLTVRGKLENMSFRTFSDKERLAEECQDENLDQTLPASEKQLSQLVQDFNNPVIRPLAN